MSKCVFKQPAINFLGLCISGNGISIDLAKVAGIKDWPRELKSEKLVQSFIGEVGYHRPFIPNFAKIAQPLTAPLKNNIPFWWEDEHHNAMEQLIGYITSSLVLAPPNKEEQFELEVDAS